MLEENTQNFKAEQVPADLTPEEPKKSIHFNGLKKGWRFWVGSVLSVALVATAAYVGITGKTGFFKGSILDNYEQKSEIVVTPVFDTVYLGDIDAPNANKALLNLVYDLPGSFYEDVSFQGFTTPDLASDTVAPDPAARVSTCTLVTGKDMYNPELEPVRFGLNAEGNTEDISANFIITISNSEGAVVASLSSNNVDLPAIKYAPSSFNWDGVDARTGTAAKPGEYTAQLRAVTSDFDPGCTDELTFTISTKDTLALDDALAGIVTEDTTTDDSTTDEITITDSSNSNVAVGPQLDAQICIHDTDVDAGETDVPEGKFHQCYALPRDYKVIDPVNRIVAVDLDDIADQLNGTYSVTAYITSEENTGYAIGTSTITTTTTLPTYYELRPSADTAPFFDPFNIERESQLTDAQVAALSGFPHGASYRVTRVDDPSEVVYREIPGFVLDGTHSDPISFDSALFEAGLHDVAVEVTFVVDPVPAADETIDRAFRIESDVAQVELRAAPVVDPNAYCSAVSVAMSNAFPSDPVVGTEIFQEYTITNSSVEDLTVGLVVSEDDSLFEFRADNQTTDIVSVPVSADSGEIVYLSITPDGVADFTSAISFVARNDATGFSCEPITLNASVSVTSAVTGGPDEVTSCEIDTNAATYNQTEDTVNFLIDATGSDSTVTSDFEVVITDYAGDVIRTLNQNNVSLPVANYNPSNGNLDWDGRNTSGTYMQNGIYTATLTASTDESDTDCTDAVNFEFDTDFRNDPGDDDEYIVTNNVDPLFVYDGPIDGPNSIYGSPYFQRNDYYPANTPSTPDLPIVPADSGTPSVPSTPSTTPTDLGFNQGATQIAGDTGPGALLYPFMFMGSAYIARRRRKK